jgi:enoyl-CoA hydratase/carnithine racemase
MNSQEALAWGFYNAVHEPEHIVSAAIELAHSVANGPTFAHAMTKRMLHEEWNMPLDDAIDAEARAQATCMETNDFRRAYEAFINGERPAFAGD